MFDTVYSQLLTSCRLIVKVTVTGFDMNTESSQIYQHMGYCPQTDAVWDALTLEEHLVLYAKIRGIPTEDVERTVEQ